MDHSSEIPSQPQSFFEVHKTALILAGIGLFFLLVGVRVLFYLVKPQQSKVEFITASESAQEKPSAITVDIAGAVENPGVYTLIANSRIQEGLLKAGGLSVEADRQWVAQHINLAQKLTDGTKLYIPKRSELKPDAAAQVAGTYTLNTSESIININNASAAQLDTLPGIGAVTAEKIIANRPYASIQELLSKKVVNKSTFEKIKEKIAL